MAIASLLLVGVLSPEAVMAKTSACEGAADTVRELSDRLQEEIQDYLLCLKTTDGSNDCAIPFYKVRNDQTDLEAAVRGYHDECDGN